MIKINLLKALKDTSTPNSDDSLSGRSFFEKLFPRKKEVTESDEELQEVPLNPIDILAKLILMLSAIFGLYYYQSINIPKLQTELEESNQKFKELIEYNNKAAASVAEIKKLQGHKALIEKQISSLDAISKVRLKYIKALDLIQSNLPEKMWLLSLKSKKNVIELEGVSFSESEISKFLDFMGRRIIFSDVSMISSEDINGRDGDKKFKKFNLNLVLESSK